ncbi:MAG: biotin/lipoyl-containing protein, partial [Nevskiales bacterium]
DKATMDVPAPQAGEVAEIKVAEGDSVAEGHVILLLRTAAASNAPADKASSSATQSKAKESAQAPAAGQKQPAES